MQDKATLLQDVIDRLLPSQPKEKVEAFEKELKELINKYPIKMITQPNGIRKYETANIQR